MNVLENFLQAEVLLFSHNISAAKGLQSMPTLLQRMPTSSVRYRARNGKPMRTLAAQFKSICRFSMMRLLVLPRL
ncbi:hypothetical protein BJF93_11250 [Xaviernesmea oryzae]|uniref:Uncharacterized protein n=1 Tax=Xaviernesmea oryzae TaxID=464029 RepID=A0A1Q9AW37_9HYPH|nr:hypothetical protein BJF93_11250 [Xaviernesmea oryzae]